MKETTKENILKVNVLITAFSQLITPSFSGFMERQRQHDDPQITPAGYTFAVWGLITMLSFGYGIYQCLPNRKNAALHQKLGRGFVVLYVLFSVWLFAAAQAWLATTVIVFVIMFFILMLLFEAVLEENNNLTFAEKILLKGQIGVYIGWTTVAIFANTAASIKFYGISDLGVGGTLWQSVLLVAALANAIAGLMKFKIQVFYTGTILWAFAGIFAGLQDENNSLFLQILTIIAIAALIVVVVYIFIKERTNKPMRSQHETTRSKRHHS